ncbi:Holliday junction resolvase RuvX [Patescibacteria group bacterium]|nr:Holliday junction resolvase RuvX [Patescibacteria group bacterium]
MKLLAIDLGTKKTGLALGDVEAKVAVPFGRLEGEKNTLEEVIRLAHAEGVEAFVVGLATAEAGQHRGQTDRTLAYIEELKRVSSLAVHVVDEQFSSAEARRMQEEYGSNISEDELAAMLILQAWLDEK